MSEARRDILQAIARNKARHRRTELPPHIVPRRALLPRTQLAELFETMARKSAATVTRIGSLDALPSATRSYLSGMGMRQQAVYLNSPGLASLNWNALPECRVATDATDRDSPVGIAQAFCGIAETGSLALLSAQSVSAAAWFLPDILIVALAGSRIYPGQEDCWLQLREQAEFPRAVTFMTGPSRTGDIEQKIVIGAHGPRHLHIALYDEP